MVAQFLTGQMCSQYIMMKRVVPSSGTEPAGASRLPPAERDAPLSWHWAESRRRSSLWGRWRGGTACLEGPYGVAPSEDCWTHCRLQPCSPELHPDASASPEIKDSLLSSLRKCRFTFLSTWMIQEADRRRESSSLFSPKIYLLQFPYLKH